jgi:hypothetical protein
MEVREREYPSSFEVGLPARRRDHIDRNIGVRQQVECPDDADANLGKYLYKGIAIGASADDVRKKLGDPKDKSDPQDLFVFSDQESAQFLYDAGKKVTAIMVTFSGKLTGAPTAKDVFGEDVAPKPDGAVFKMVRYPKAGYWVSYNKIVGDDSMVSIAMQKM